MDRLVIPEPSNEVVVRVEPGRPARGELTLRNAMHTMPVAFRLQPAVRGRFAVRPHTGILAPLAAVTVEVLYLASAAPEGPGGGRGEDSFLLHSVVAPGAAVREPVSALDSVNPEWFSARKKQVFVDSGIRACFVGATVAARLVAAGAVEALREVLDRSDPPRLSRGSLRWCGCWKRPAGPGGRISERRRRRRWWGRAGAWTGGGGRGRGAAAPYGSVVAGKKGTKLPRLRWAGRTS